MRRGAPICQRCRRPATFAVCCDAGTVRLCRRHARELADRLADDPIVLVGRRRVRLDAPRLEGVRR